MKIIHEGQQTAAYTQGTNIRDSQLQHIHKGQQTAAYTQGTANCSIYTRDSNCLFLFLVMRGSLKAQILRRCKAHFLTDAVLAGMVQIWRYSF
jgi:hypothetical protein